MGLFSVPQDEGKVENGRYLVCASAETGKIAGDLPTVKSSCFDRFADAIKCYMKCCGNYRYSDVIIVDTETDEIVRQYVCKDGRVYIR